MIRSVDLHASFRRALLLLPIILALTGSWFAVRWHIGNTIAEYGPGAEEGGMVAAQAAVRLAPDDPLTHWRLASLEKEDLQSNLLDDAVRHFEEAVRLSPNDYRLWAELGPALEQTGDIARAEAALRRAVELAPAYVYPRWYLGNLLLREGKVEDAFAELSRVSASESRLRLQVFNLAWQVFGEDVDAISRSACPTLEARGDLISYLIERQKIDGALRVWAGLSDAEKEQQHDKGDRLSRSLIGLKRYYAAFEVARNIPSDKTRPQLGQFVNGGFETELADAGANHFGWSVSSAPQLQIAIDPSQHHLGSRSLRLIFRAPSDLSGINVSQLIVVEPNATYRLECYARTKDLQSAATPVIEVEEATDGTPLGGSEPLAAGSSDWQKVTFDFDTKSRTEAVRVRISRGGCGAAPVCPIFGTVWYDDFNLRSITGRKGASVAGKN